MSRNALKTEILKYVHANFPAIYLHTSEESKAIEIIKDLAENNLKDDIQHLYTYDIDKGYEIIKGKDKRIALEKRENNLAEAFKFIHDNIQTKSFIIYNDINQIIKDNPILIRKLKNLLSKVDREYTIFIISSHLSIPQEIEKDVVILDVQLPKRDEISYTLENFIAHHSLPGITDDIKNKLIEALNGLTESEITYILELSHNISEEAILNINKYKQQQFKKNSVLEYCSDNETTENDIGGLDNVRKWLNNKKKIFEKLEKARESGVDVPKGLLLFGMPGCGKSLIAKVIAKSFNMPLLKLDMGMIMGPYVGQSEENIRKAIKLSEAISPSVLWIDELEKTLSGSGKAGSSSDVTTRILATLLTWMQEKTKPVFIVATANNVSGIPPELMRKGRFDEIFFVDFPNEEEIFQILKIHFKKRKQDNVVKMLDNDNNATKKRISLILKKEKKFSGADIEALIKEMVEDKFIHNEEIDVNKIIKKLEDIKSIKDTMGDAIKDLEAAFKSFHAVPASSQKN